MAEILIALLFLVLLLIAGVAWILTTLNTLMATQTEIVAQLTAFQTQLRKAIDELKAAIANQSNASPELVAAAAALGALVQEADDVVPDAPAPTPEPVQAS